MWHTDRRTDGGALQYLPSRAEKFLHKFVRKWVCSITTTEDLLKLLRREGFILSTRFARIDLTECFFLFHLNRRWRGMTRQVAVWKHMPKCIFQRKSRQFLNVKIWLCFYPIDLYIRYIFLFIFCFQKW